jgi:hypothetical protein
VSRHRGILMYGTQGYAHSRYWAGRQSGKTSPLKQINGGNVAATLAMENAYV